VDLFAARPVLEAFRNDDHIPGQPRAGWYILTSLADKNGPSFRVILTDGSLRAMDEIIPTLLTDSMIGPDNSIGNRMTY
jgi:hypothetical protein